MIVTVLWEDAAVQMKNFGPHLLLLCCLADERGCEWHALSGTVKSVAKRGNGNVLRALREELELLVEMGAVTAILDKDKAHKLWSTVKPPIMCFSGLTKALRADAPGPYELVFLEDNAETLIAQACAILGQPKPAQKPSPDERDLLLNKLAFSSPENRKKLRDAVPSFDRLVRKVLAVLPAP